MTRSPSSAKLTALPVLLALLAGCASSGVPPSQMAGPEPQPSVERFLQAANARDLDAMAGIFGTADGPIATRTGSSVGCAVRRMGSWIGLSERCMSWQDIEVWMDTVAYILRHDEFRMRSEDRVAGRAHPTTRVGVDLKQGQREFADVPFLVVQTSSGAWLVEEIGLERITSGR